MKKTLLLTCGGLIFGVSQPWIRWQTGRSQTVSLLSGSTVELRHPEIASWTLLFDDIYLFSILLSILLIGAIILLRPTWQWSPQVVAIMGVVPIYISSDVITTLFKSWLLIRINGTTFAASQISPGFGSYIVLIGGTVITAVGTYNWISSMFDYSLKGRTSGLLSKIWGTRLPELLVLAFLLRLFVAIRFPGVESDLTSYRLVGEAVLQGENIYSTMANRYPDFPGHRYPYFPGWMFIEALMVIIVNTLHVPFGIVARLPGIFADVLVTGVIFYTLDGGYANGRLTPNQGAFLHAVNPVSIYVVARHGQFDSLPFLAVILAILFIYQNHQRRSALTLGMGILFKPIPIFLGLLFLIKQSTRRQRAVYFSLASLPPFLVSLPFIFLSPGRFLDATLGYKSMGLIGWYGVVKRLGGMFGYEALAMHGTEIDSVILSISKIPLVFTVILASWWYYRYQSTISLWRAVLLVVLIFYVVSAGNAPQYLYWATPFLALVAIANWYRVVYIGSAYLTLHWGDHLEPLLTAILSPSHPLINDISYLFVNVLFWFVAIVGVYLTIHTENSHQ